EFKLVLSKNITPLYNQRINSYKLFIVVDIIFSTLLAICMFYISKQLTRPIETLSDISILISNGDYSKRIEKIYNDEFGVLANNFNSMVEALQNNIEKLDVLNSDKQRFIDNLNHEIKTPITSIIGYSELLLNANLDENIKLKCLQYINSESKRLASLNSSLLRLTLLKEDELNLKSIRLNDIITFACNSLDVKLKEKNINLKIDIINYIFTSDWDLMSILIINILENAIKASSGESTIEIKINKLNQLEIIDFGEGIPDSDLEKIKQPFYMVDKSRDRKKNGLGLGLSICNQICDRLDITFNIDSELGVGTTVIIDISKEILKNE
ncbi:MAG: HAMP domain-containing sensor histidine kinase, partial [Romboutsia sp.]